MEFRLEREYSLSLTEIMHQRFVHQPDIKCRVQGLEDQEVKNLTRISRHVKKGDQG